MRLVQHRATFGARMMIGFWTILILMPPELQEMVIMDSLAFITVAAIIIMEMVQKEMATPSLGFRNPWASASLATLAAIVLDNSVAYGIPAKVQ